LTYIDFKYGYLSDYSNRKEFKDLYFKAIKSEVISRHNILIDTTGYGDAFQAAFSIEWLKTKNIEKSLKAGSIAANKVLNFVDGVEQE